MFIHSIKSLLQKMVPYAFVFLLFLLSTFASVKTYPSCNRFCKYELACSYLHVSSLIENSKYCSHLILNPYYGKTVSEVIVVIFKAPTMPWVSTVDLRLLKYLKLGLHEFLAPEFRIRFRLRILESESHEKKKIFKFDNLSP